MEELRVNKENSNKPLSRQRSCFKSTMSTVSPVPQPSACPRGRRSPCSGCFARVLRAQAWRRGSALTRTHLARWTWARLSESVAAIYARPAPHGAGSGHVPRRACKPAAGALVGACWLVRLHSGPGRCSRAWAEVGRNAATLQTPCSGCSPFRPSGLRHRTFSRNTVGT